MKDTRPSVQEIRQSEERFLSSDIVDERIRIFLPRNGKGPLTDPAHGIPVCHYCDGPVVGGGPTETAAAFAASRCRRDGCSRYPAQSRCFRAEPRSGRIGQLRQRPCGPLTSWAVADPILCHG